MFALSATAQVQSEKRACRERRSDCRVSEILFSFAFVSSFRANVEDLNLELANLSKSEDMSGLALMLGWYQDMGQAGLTTSHV